MTPPNHVTMYYILRTARELPQTSINTICLIFMFFICTESVLLRAPYNSRTLPKLPVGFEQLCQSHQVAPELRGRERHALPFLGIL